MAGRIGRAVALAAAMAMAGATSGAVAAADGGVPQGGAKADQIRAVLAGIRLPEGFRISLFALVPGARHMAVGPQGKVLFVGSRGSGVHAVDLTATNGERRVWRFAPDVAFSVPNGPCFAPDGTLYVAEVNRIRAFANAESEAARPAPPSREVVAEGDLAPAGETGGHNARVCRIGPDGRLYVAIGQPHNVPPKAKLALYAERGLGAIVRMDRDGGHREIYASGIRNSVGLDFNPADGTLWFTDNQVDLMGNTIPPGEIDRATAAGQNFGFPWYGGGAVRTREYADDPVPPGVVFPQVEMDAHAADLGMVFYLGTTWPAPWRGGIFSAQHGSWNRQPSIGARVMFTSVKPDGTAGATMVFAEGWRRADGSYAGRPVDVAELPDGSLLVSDDAVGAVYRIEWTQK